MAASSSASLISSFIYGSIFELRLLFWILDYIKELPVAWIAFISYSSYFITSF
jgi:hypothetical protein